MTGYPFPSIFINDREVELEEIISNNAKARSDFEDSTFSFIRSWLGGALEFHQNTSGSTGAPKTISISRTQMEISARLTEEALQLKSGYRALVCLDTRYIAGKMMLVRSFVTGMKIVAVNPSANPFTEIDPHQHIDFAAFVPYQVAEISSSHLASRLNSIQVAIIGGAALDNTLRQRLQSFDCQLYATYGMTETVSHIALQKLNGPDASESFQTLPGVEIDSDDRSCLTIKCPMVTKELHTNDIVEIISPKEFKWVGRYDNVINSGGVKISPERVEIEIEKFFRDAAIDRPFFVAGLPDKRLGQRIVLLVEGERLEEGVIEKINLMFKHALLSYESPKEILFKKTFFYTDTGKVNRLKTIDIVEN